MKSVKNYMGMMLEFFEIVFIGVAVFLVVYIFIGQLMEVVGDSMLPTFHDKERLVAEKVSVKLKPLSRGEVIILKHPSDPRVLLIKRVIGLPGEEFMISNGRVYINNAPLEEPYIPDNVITIGKGLLSDNTPIKIGYDKYIVLGDNRTNSSDSRDWGELPAELVVGRGVFVYYPMQQFRMIK